jgi:Flp pilus assembly protein TadD
MNPTPTIEELIQQIEWLKQQNLYGDARETALQWLVRHTDDYRLYEELADIYLFENNFEKAEEVITYARALHPDSGTGMYLEGYIAVTRGDFDHAVTLLTCANTLIPNNAEVIRNLGWAYVMQGEITRGLGLLRRAYALSPTDPMIINDLGVALIASGAEAEAQAFFLKTGTVNPLEMAKMTY